MALLTDAYDAHRRKILAAAAAPSLVSSGGGTQYAFREALWAHPTLAVDVLSKEICRAWNCDKLRCGGGSPCLVVHDRKALQGGRCATFGWDPGQGRRSRGGV